MMNMEKYRNVEEYVKNLFSGAVDKADAPYYHHCEYVANYGRTYAEALGLAEEEVEAVYLAGLCHDVLEDCGDRVSEEELGLLIGQKALSLVKTLTNREGKDGYDAYFEGIKKNRLASIVKLADATHNGDVTRFREEDRTPKCVEKSLFYLSHVLELQKILASGS
ncbi:MAG: HD domain-containing protein [Spirochaetales bacterium]|nr:HD domain-containing protein [Candidatus Physcosoma equi]